MGGGRGGGAGPTVGCQVSIKVRRRLRVWLLGVVSVTGREGA